VNPDLRYISNRIPTVCVTVPRIILFSLVLLFFYILRNFGSSKAEEVNFANHVTASAVLKVMYITTNTTAVK
jgi:hypothetical protein